MNRRLAAVPALLLLVVSGNAAAHTGIGPTAGLGAGFGHPLLGVDHLLAMVAVGLWASVAGGRALWLVPIAFVGTMLAGGALALFGIPLPGVELMIALSVVVLGSAVLARARLPVAAAMGVAALFAVFHGHAHGAEMPAGASGLLYGLGFAAATASLHAVGVGVGITARRFAAEPALRLGGGAVALAGFLILVAG